MSSGYLITVHGLILCYDVIGQRLVGRRKPEGRPIVHVAVDERQALFHILADGVTSYLSLGECVSLTDCPHPASRLSLMRDADYYLRFCWSQKFLSANPDGTCDFKIWNEVFERFLFVEPGSRIDTLLSSSWYSRSQQTFVGWLKIEEGFTIKIGAISISLEQFMTYSFEDSGDIYYIYGDFCVDVLIRSMPLVYFTAFGRDDTFIALNMCIESIERFGQYAGHYLILTDRPSNILNEFIPQDCRERVIVRNFLAFDTIDFVNARFHLPSIDEVSRFQPIIYCDVDIICSGSLAPVMSKAIQGDSILARSEGAVDLIHYGSTLMSSDAFPRLQKSLGFNSGVLAFKNVDQVRSIFSIILASLHSHLNRGLTRHATNSFDQPVANYVFNKIAVFDVEQLTEHVHPCLPSMDDHIASDGLIHFFGGVGASHKIERMRKVFDRLRLRHSDKAS